VKYYLGNITLNINYIEMKALPNYLKIFIVNSFILIVLRILETTLILIHFGTQYSLVFSEILGLFQDLAITNFILLLFSPLYYFFNRYSNKLAIGFFLFLIGTMTILHFLILKYFLYQLMPLDISLYKYSFKEIFFTVSTSDTSFLKAIALLLIVLSCIFISYKFFKKWNFSKKQFIITSIIITLSFIVTMFLHQFNFIIFNKFSDNKPFYFYYRSLDYFIHGDLKNEPYTKKDFIDFQKLYPGKSFVSGEYPLLHDFKNNNVLGPYFNKFDSAPNIVILIVESLNDDFVHKYRGIDLMPFLDSLKNKSLYWSHCFSLGERSFAVVPSITGSLPYGETGFTLQETLPRHLSLVSILKENNYFTTFFYGQGSWFHRKDRYFRNNNIDILFDDVKFSNNYSKIIVGHDNFFWGFNDKDLFNQSFEVLDTLICKPKFNIYFTGTSHTPFVITNQEYYDKKYSRIIGSLKNKDDIKLFKTIKKYAQAVIFVNDALEDFFKKYKQRPDYENSIFIITGDHPSTEFPIANSLKKYHVPLIIFSPKLKQAKTFNKIASHLDVYETLLSFLSDYCKIVPKYSTAIGSVLNVDESERDVKIAFMNDNRELVDYYSNGYYLSDKKLYSVNNDLSLKLSDNKSILETLKRELKTFNKTSLYVCVNDKLISDSLYCSSLGYKLTFNLNNRNDTNKFNSEYFELVNNTEIKNADTYYDISFNYVNTDLGDFSLVYQLTNKKDSIILWKNTGITFEKGIYQHHIIISKQNVSYPTLFFKSFFWNRSQKQFEFRKLKISLYEK
jgi:phosphoglycerol transferase MdoB-like AlkP superfamily enzyme